MLVIVENVTSKNEESSDDSEVIRKAAESIERDIEDLLRYAQLPGLYYETIIDC